MKLHEIRDENNESLSRNIVKSDHETPKEITQLLHVIHPPNQHEAVRDSTTPLICIHQRMTHG